jgi:DNA-binding transcriptional LysR family regulator
MINLRLLEFGVALDRHRRFSHAAEAMGVTQPTFSRGIAALEKSLGARLFDRSTRHVEPTPVGRLLLERARRLLADAAQIGSALGDYQSLQSGRVTVGVGPYPLDISVIECVVRLASRHPGLQVELREGPWREFGARLLSGELEVAVAELSIVAADPRFRVDALPVHDGCFYCRGGHPLSGRRRVTMPEILQYPLVGTRLPPRLLPLPLEGRGASLDPVTGDVLPHVTTTSFAAARAIVERTDGIGLAVSAQIGSDVRRGLLAILHTEAEGLRSGYGIVWARDRSLSPGAQAFVSVLEEVEAELAAASSRPGPRAPARRHRSSRRKG